MIAEDVIRKAADPMRLLEWQAQHGLTVASVNRYLLNLLTAEPPICAECVAPLDQLCGDA